MIIQHDWGMTELSPIGTINAPKRNIRNMDAHANYKNQIKQGRALFGYVMKVVDDEGKTLPRNGRSSVRLLSRGHWVLSNYYKKNSQ